MGTLDEDINKLRTQANKDLEQASQLETLQEAFPDIRKYVGRWNKVVFCSKSVNSRVTNYDSRHNCGCCSDSPLEVWPHLETPQGRIYSDPPEFKVGERHPIFGGDIPYAGWQDQLRAENIPEALIQCIAGHFKQEAEDVLEAVDAAYSDQDDDAHDPGR